MKSSFLETFANPGSEYRGAPFWAWNGALDPEELRRQVRVMHRMGLGGFFMHSRVGLDTPYLSEEWFDCVKACLDEAETLDMQAWLYDEDRWPSGAAGGLVTRHPEYRMRHVVMDRFTAAADVVWTDETLAVFAAQVDGGAATGVRRLRRGRHGVRLRSGETALRFRLELQACSPWYNGYTYLDVLNHKAVREFIRVTHEAYKSRCGGAFGSRIPGIFTDEPNYGHGHFLPWTGALPKTFKTRYGYSIIDHLPALVFDIDGSVVSRAALHYYDCVTHLFVDAFARQIGDWCEANGLQHTGHVLLEDTLSSQTAVVGSAMRFYEYMQAPGMDLLTERWRVYDTAKQVSSVARQFDRKWRLTETYGCTGWDFPLEGHKALGDWQAALGINLRCQHLSWYTMEGQAKRDYPASIFYQSPWWELYGTVEDYFARVHAVMTRGKEVRDVLVIHPIESMWAQYRPTDDHRKRFDDYDHVLIDLRDTLLRANIDFDYGDEDILARHARVLRKGGAPSLRVNRAVYTTVVVPPLLTIRPSTVDLLARFHKAGGTVVFAGPPPTNVDGVFSEEAARLARACVMAPARGPGLAGAVADGRRLSITDAAGREVDAALHLLREDREAFYLFVVNTSHKASQFAGDATGSDFPVRERTVSYPDVTITGFGACAGHPLELDPSTGEWFRGDARRGRDGWRIRTRLPRFGSRLFVIPKLAEAIQAPRRRALVAARTRALGGRWRYRLSEHNVLVLDRPRSRIGDGDWQAADEVLRVDHRVREAMGMAPRGGQMVQPWAREKSQQPRRTRVELSYGFNVSQRPSGGLKLALERPDTFRVFLNGQEVSTDTTDGSWCDRSLRTLPLNGSALRLGENCLALVCDYAEDHPGLETVYLLGAFGVEVDGTSVTLGALPGHLVAGDWVSQGLPFYTGSVMYERTVTPILAPRERLFVQVPRYEGAAVRVSVDGKPAGVMAWEPNEVEITDLVAGDAPAALTIEVFGHRRNSHGPLHEVPLRPYAVGPGNFTTDGKQWTDNYQLVPCGLMKAPRLVVKRLGARA